MTAASAIRRMLPFDGPVDAVVRVPGSKSFTNRALVCAALARGESTLERVLASDDTEAMFGCLDALGIVVAHDPVLHRAVVHGAGGVVGSGRRHSTSASPGPQRASSHRWWRWGAVASPLTGTRRCGLGRWPISYARLRCSVSTSQLRKVVGCLFGSMQKASKEEWSRSRERRRANSSVDCCFLHRATRVPSSSRSRVTSCRNRMWT